MPTIIHTPQTLHMLANEAQDYGEPVTLSPADARATADAWHADIEKIRYLEALITHIASHGSACCVLAAVNEETRERIVHELRKGAGLTSIDTGPSAPTYPTM